jgi:CheY-like chemotaxis protein
MSRDNLSSNSNRCDNPLIRESDLLKLHDHNNHKEITFINYTYSYCICIIDIVNSTLITKELTNSEKIRRYYSIFLNTMASIIKQHNGKVIKNAGDCLIFYFPRTVHLINESAFQDVIECGLAMIHANSHVNLCLNKNELPNVNYRISANYGKVELATSTNSNVIDLFVPTVNICSKINPLASPNEMVIYKDLYDIIKKASFFEKYYFTEMIKSDINGKYCIYPYRVYSVHYSRKSVYNQYLAPNEIIFHKTHNKQSKANSSFNILIIDDDKDLLYIFSNIIKSEGYNTISYSDPIEAWNHFSNVSPYYFDIILTDIRMPGINGIKLYYKFKTINPDIKILFISALDAAEELISTFSDIKNTDFIRKPVDRKYLLSKVKSVLLI